MRKIISQQIAGIFMVIAVTLFSGCVTSTGNFANLRPDDDVKKTFERFTVDPEYMYYYYGRVNFPRTFVGISKGYTLGSPLWKPIDLTSEHLHSWIWGQASRYPGDLKRYGYAIIAPNGEKIGVWYSLEDWQQWAKIGLGDNKTITIGTPINTRIRTVGRLNL